MQWSIFYCSRLEGFFQSYLEVNLESAAPKART